MYKNNQRFKAAESNNDVTFYTKFENIDDLLFLIYKNIKTPTQSGFLKEDYFVVSPCSLSSIDFKNNKNIMNYLSSKNNINQINLHFAELDQAIDYCVKRNYKYQVIQTDKTQSTKIITKKSYTENFTS